jgi:hypothetical protein
MRLVIDSTTRFFSVVGAPYIAEHHYDNSSDDDEVPGSHRPAYLAVLPRPCTSTSWLQDDR